MLKKINASFLLALHNIRSHFFHTILSVLGIVIGVASLVSILSLIDGMEKYAKDQITNTTSLKAIAIRSEYYKYVNGVSIRKDSVDFIDYRSFLELRAKLTLPAKGFLFSGDTREANLSGDTVNTGTHAFGVSGFDTAYHVVHGRKLSDADIQNHKPVSVITEITAKALSKKDSARSLIGKTLEVNNQTLTIVGIVRSSKISRAEVFFPITLFTRKELLAHPPACVIEAENVEDVPKLKEEVTQWIKNKFKDTEDFSIATNDMRVQQAAKGFQLFRIIMGMIVGISVLVGGIGVMNVLLISVTERTVEIGIRKAVGANKRDIILQFLSESITISMFGSMIGLITGIIGTMILISIIKSFVEVPFQAAYTWNTFFVITTLAVVVGVVFGTYPALRASRLDPVEAIRRE